MSRRMEYTIAFYAPAEKIYQDLTSCEYWQSHIKGLLDAEEAFTADWIREHH